MPNLKGLANVGDVLAGKYRVEKILGIGGMGMVVSAMHVELEHQVAIKFMLPAALESPEAAARFMREARAAGRLTSDHVCRVSDVGRFETGVPYIVMEYLDGADLGTLLKRRGPLPVEQAADYIIQAAEGMAEAHAHGIVHRDLKPDNLFLATRTDGVQLIKVLDFGISKAHVTGIATRTGDIMGSPAYMAPEQMQSTKDVDARADIWSLGVILYQLITGRMPFVADTLPALCLAVMHDPPPPLAGVRRDLPPGFAEVVMRCLAKDKHARYQNVGDLAAALAPFGPPHARLALGRITGMLQRKRAATPSTAPLMMLPSEFNDVLKAPTLGPGDTIDLPLPKADGTLPPGSQRELVAVSAGLRSGPHAGGPLIERSSSRLPLALIGAIAGALALIALIIAMAMMKRGASAESRRAVTPPPPSVTELPEPTPQPEPAAPPAAPDSEAAAPITQPPAYELGSSEGQDGKAPELLTQPEAPVIQPPAAAPELRSSESQDGKPPRGATSRVRPKDRGTGRPGKGGSAGASKQPGDAVKAEPPAPPPAAAPTDDGSDGDDDVWGRMHHDEPKPGSGSGAP